ncbi:zinc finger protein OZF-like [Chrysoperla carnea]|uniref:zinc finger protein OZF-like n=1 Tax=Chrysoperla carnea TaxID=189513 RepID=UPI001D079DBB|nr:zinc finger protein OZF-like [Chrysoperla carnea]
MDTCPIDDFDKVCRICMKFDKKFLSITSFKIIDMIIACASVRIWENDDLPNQICENCFLQLQNTVTFKQLCETSDNAFRQIIKKSKINLPNNQNDSVNVKDEQFDDYQDDNSSIDIKEEDFSEIRDDYNEDNFEKSETNSFLDIKNKDKSELKLEEENDSIKNIKDEEEVEEKFACEKCNKEFKKIWVLGQHMHYKHRVKQLKCSDCKMKFYHPLHLKQHQELTHNVSNLTCDICNKIVSRINDLKRHKLTHLKQRPGKKLIPCQRCDKSFQDKRDLKSHNKEAHSQIEKYVACHVCGKSVCKKNLSTHLAIHKERDKIPCDLCSNTFISQSTLSAHIKNVHRDPTESAPRNHLCSICGHAMRTAPELRRHLLIHTNERPYACDQCDKTYRIKENLTEHIKAAHLNERKFQCTFCPQAFNHKKTLVHHERRHTGEKPHKCEVCGRRFIQRISLKLHSKTHTNSKENLSLLSLDGIYNGEAHMV